MLYDKRSIALTLETSNTLLECIGLKKAKGYYNKDRQKKLDEIIGFCEYLFKVIKDYEKDKEVVFLECSCGKSYLSFTLNYLLINLYKDMKTFFWGIDTNKERINKCNHIKSLLDYHNMQFIEDRTINFTPEKDVDVVLALHACDTATDEAIAKGIKIGAKYIIVVPCCQNQIRAQLKRDHLLTGLTDFGLLRYRFADILTDALRSQFLKGNGYNVELKEITTIKTTPKNMIIIARKKKQDAKKTLDGYNKLRKIFDIDFRLQDFFPEHAWEN